MRKKYVEIVAAEPARTLEFYPGDMKVRERNALEVVWREIEEENRQRAAVMAD